MLFFGESAVYAAAPRTNPPTDVLAHFRIDTSSTNITTAAFVELAAATALLQTCKGLMVQNNTSSALTLARGVAGSEVNYITIPPGGFEGIVDVFIGTSTRLSLRAVSANATAGEVIIQCYF